MALAQRGFAALAQLFRLHLALPRIRQNFIQACAHACCQQGLPFGGGDLNAHGDGFELLNLADGGGKAIRLAKLLVRFKLFEKRQERKPAAERDAEQHPENFERTKGSMAVLHDGPGRSEEEKVRDDEGENVDPWIGFGAHDVGKLGESPTSGDGKLDELWMLGSGPVNESRGRLPETAAGRRCPHRARLRVGCNGFLNNSNLNPARWGQTRPTRGMHVELDHPRSVCVDTNPGRP